MPAPGPILATGRPWRESVSDTTGTVTTGTATALDCHDTLLQATSEAQQLVGIGLKDIIAVAMPDAVLVAHKDRAQDVNRPSPR